MGLIKVLKEKKANKKEHKKEFTNGRGIKDE